uniref:CAP-Gly domain-containing protein n=1 Tax=Panagrolaimus superbus TaxID=310955 RepID=A0A914Z0D8_9BILA
MATAKPNYKIGDYVLSKKGKGTVRYVGPIEAANDQTKIFAGLELDEPNGKNNGSTQGKVYFECPENYGIFVPVETLANLPKMLTKPPSNPVRSNRASELRQELGSTIGSDITGVTGMSKMSTFNNMPAVRQAQNVNTKTYHHDLQANLKKVLDQLEAEQDKNATLQARIQELERATGSGDDEEFEKQELIVKVESLEEVKKTLEEKLRETNVSLERNMAMLASQNDEVHLLQKTVEDLKVSNTRITTASASPHFNNESILKEKDELSKRIAVLESNLKEALTSSTQTQEKLNENLINAKKEAENHVKEKNELLKRLQEVETKFSNILKSEAEIQEKLNQDLTDAKNQAQNENIRLLKHLEEVENKLSDTLKAEAENNRDFDMAKEEAENFVKEKRELLDHVQGLKEKLDDASKSAMNEKNELSFKNWKRNSRKT